MKSVPTVYIILLNWHGWRDTIGCLDSLSRLDYPNYHILVVDNGSTDDSVALIRAAHPKVPLIETGRNLGFSGGCNVGIRHAFEAGVEYVWLLNNDTTVDPQALSAMVTMAESNPQIGAVGSVLYYLNDPKKIQAWGGGKVCYWSGRSWHQHGPTASQDLQYLTAASVLLRRRALEEVGLLDEGTFFMYWEDTDLSFRLRKAGWRLAVADQSIVLHREHASTGRGHPLLDFYFNESAARFFRRHARWAFWPIGVGTMGRLTKRIIQGNFSGAMATLHGIYGGIRRRR